MKMKKIISQRNIVLLCYSYNMAAANTHIFCLSVFFFFFFFFWRGGGGLGEGWGLQLSVFKISMIYSHSDKDSHLSQNSFILNFFFWGGGGGAGG